MTVYLDDKVNKDVYDEWNAAYWMAVKDENLVQVIIVQVILDLFNFIWFNALYVFSHYPSSAVLMRKNTAPR